MTETRIIRSAYVPTADSASACAQLDEAATRNPTLGAVAVLPELQRRFTIARFDRLTQAHGTQHECTLDELRELLSTHAKRAAKDGPLVSFAHYDPQNVHRIMPNVLGVSGLLIDFDNSTGKGDGAVCSPRPTSPDDHVDNLGGIAYGWYSTHSNAPGWPKWRLWVPLSRDLTPGEFMAAHDGLCALLARDSNIDASCKEIARAYYLPSCTLRGHAAAFSGFHPGALVTPESLFECASIPPKEIHTPPKVVHSGLADSAGRNDSLKTIATAMIHRGETNDAIAAELMSVDAKHTPPLFTDSSDGYHSDAYTGACLFVARIRASINQDRAAKGSVPIEPSISVVPRAISGQGGPPRIVTFHSARELLASPAPIRWLVRNHLSLDSLAGLVGPSGSGKTFLALDWACCVVTGTPWAGQAITQGAVFVIAGEGHAGIRRRLQAWQEARRIDLRDAPIYVSGGAVLLAEKPNAQAVQQACELLSQQSGVRPALIVVDTLARNYGADENSASDMGTFISNLDAYLRMPWGCTVLTIHHTGHGEGQQNRARGSSAFRGALDVEFNVQLTGKQMKVTCTKAKDWEPPEPLTADLRPVKIAWLDSDGEPETSCIVDTGAATVVANMKGATQRQRRALDLLKALYAAKRDRLSADGLPADSARVSEDEFRAALATSGAVADRYQWRDLRAQLFGRSMIRADGNCVYPVQTGP